MPRIGAAHRPRDREAGRHQLWSPLRWPASTRLPSCAAAAHRPEPHGRRPSPAPRSFDGGLVSLGPTRPGHPHRPITIARVLVPRLRSIRLLFRPDPAGWPMLRTACAGPHRTLIHWTAQNPHSFCCTAPPFRLMPRPISAWPRPASECVPAWGGCKEMLLRHMADRRRPGGPMPLSMRPTEGPAENIKMIEAGEAQVGFVTMGVAQQGWNGTGD